MRILHETGSRRLPEIDLCINTSVTGRRKARPVRLPPCPPPRRFSLLLSLLARAVRLCVPYRIVKPLFSVRTAGQKESSCLRLLVNPRVSRPGDSHDYVIQLGRGLQLLSERPESSEKNVYRENFFFFFRKNNYRTIGDFISIYKFINYYRYIVCTSIYGITLYEIIRRHDVLRRK